MSAQLVIPIAMVAILATEALWNWFQECLFADDFYNYEGTGLRLGDSMPCVVITDFCRVSFPTDQCQMRHDQHFAYYIYKLE